MIQYIVVSVDVQREILAAMRPHVQALAEVPGIPSQFAAAMEAAQALSGGVLLAQLAFYVWLHWYVGRPHVVALLSPTRT